MKRHKAIIIATSLGVILVAVAVGLWLGLRSTEPFPQSVLKEVNYPLFYPSQLNQVKISKPSIKYNKQQGSISYIVYLNQTELTFSEQASPETFTYDSSLYPQFVDKFGNYASFDSLDGTVYLTQLPGSNSQTAIMDSKGTLLFVRTDNSTMSQNRWKLLFNTIEFTLPR